MATQTFLQGTSCVLDDTSDAPVYAGQEKYNSGTFQRKDSVGTYDPRTVWFSAHIAANVLPHLVDEWLGQGYYCTIEGQPFVTKRTFYNDSTMAKRLAQVTYTRDSQQRCTQLTSVVYKADGASMAAQAVDTYTYTGPFPSSVVRQVTSF